MCGPTLRSTGRGPAVRSRRPAGVRFVPIALGAALAALPASALAYTPGSGTVLSENFNGPLDADWEQGNGITFSPWTQAFDGPDRASVADGQGPFPGSPTAHWSRRFVTPVDGDTFSMAWELRGDRVAGWSFEADVEQRAPTTRAIRFAIDDQGALSLWRSEGGAMVQKAATGPNVLPVDVRRWIRLTIEPGTGGRWVRARVWAGGATSEPAAGWTVEFLDDLQVVERAHRFSLTADGPVGKKTWLDDLDVFGDTGNGILSSIDTIHVVEFSHNDIGFTAPPDDIELFAKTHVDDVLDNLEADPDYRWLIESSWWLDRWWEQSTPSERQRMVGHLQGVRLELGGGYANLYTSTSGYETLTRNLYYSSSVAREHGFATRTWLTNDIPGTRFDVPEIIERSGLEFFIGGMNSVFGGAVDAPDHGDLPFWWKGPDGSRVLAWTSFEAYTEGLAWGLGFFDSLPDLFHALGKKIPEREEAGYDWSDLMLMRAHDNWYQGFYVRDLVDQWNATYDTPVLVLSTPSEFFDHMLATHGAAAFPEFSGDYGAAWGVSRAGAQHVQEWTRQARRDGRNAEALLAAGVALDGTPAPHDDTRLLYRRLLEQDAIDAGGGWPGFFTPEEMDRNNQIFVDWAEEARDTAAALVEQGLDRALAELPSPGDAVVAVNPLGRPREGWARLALPAAVYDETFRLVDRATSVEIPYQRFDATKEILFRATGLPAMGYRVYDVVPGTPTASPGGLLSVGATLIENDFYRLQVDPADGALTSLFDKTRGREMIDPASPYRFNALAKNTKAEYDFAVPPVAQPPASASVIVDSPGPLLGALTVTRTGTPHVETTYRLYREDDRVEIENVLDRDLMPYVPFSTAIEAYTVTLPFDLHNLSIRVESTSRFLDPVADGFPRPGVFDWHNVEHVLGLHDATSGLVVSVDACVAHHLETFTSLVSTAYKTGDGLILTRLKDQVDEAEFEGGSVGPYEQEPGTSPLHRSRHHVRATAPGFDPVAASRFGFEALEPVRARFVGRRPGNLPSATASFFNVDAPGVLLYTAKPAEDDDGLIFRMVEQTGAPVTATIGSGAFTFLSAERVAQDEEGGVPLTVSPAGIAVPLQPYETATVRARSETAWAPITIHAEKNAPAGAVRLTWTGGVSPYTVRRSDDAQFTSGVVPVVDEAAVTSHDDPVLTDGATYFYLAF